MVGAWCIDEFLIKALQKNKNCSLDKIEQTSFIIS